MTIQEQETGNIGHNLPPSEDELLLEQLAAGIAAIAERLKDLTDAAAGSPDAITDTDTEEKVTLLAGQIMKATKEADAQRKAAKDPHLRANRIIEAHYMGIITPAKDAIKALNGKINTWLNEQRRRREAEAERLRKEAEEKAAKAKTAEDLEEVNRLADEALTAEAPVHAHSGYGQTAAQRTEKVWIVEDETKIPQAYWMLNEVAINAARQKDIPIPGIKYDTETSTHTRS